MISIIIVHKSHASGFSRVFPAAVVADRGGDGGGGEGGGRHASEEGYDWHVRSS